MFRSHNLHHYNLFFASIRQCVAASQSLDPLIAHIDRQCAANGGSLLHTRFQYDLDHPTKPGEKKRRHSTDGPAVPKTVAESAHPVPVVCNEANADASKL